MKIKKYMLLALMIISLTACSSKSQNNDESDLSSEVDYSESSEIVLNDNLVTESDIEDENPTGPHPDNTLIEIDGSFYSWTPNVTVFAVKDGNGYNLSGCEYDYSSYVDEFNTLVFIGTGDKFGLNDAFSLYKTSDNNIFVTYKCSDVKAYADSSEWLKTYSEDMFFEGFVYKGEQAVGVAAPEDYVTPTSCFPIDKSLDCERLLLDRAEMLAEMMMKYYYPSQETRAYALGEFEVLEELGSAREVSSDEFKTYSEFKALFSDVIYEQYIDFINFSDSGFREYDERIYFVDFVSGGPRGSIETWYLGCDIEDDKIIGHFAELHADAGSDEPLGTEYLNDESNYSFYDIIVQNVDGKYVLTNCINSNDYPYHIEHGRLYDSGKADRSLVTNEKVKPRF